METREIHLTQTEVATPIASSFGARLLRARLELVLIVALGLAVLAPGLARAPLLDWDEATYVQVVHEAIANRHYLEFSWNGAPYLKKPPMLFWVVAGSFKTFGESELAARMPSMICALLTMLLLYASGCEVGGRISGTFAAIIPLGFYFFVARGGRECATDPLLVMFSTLALYAMMRGREQRRWLPIAGAAIGLAILSKGAAGLIPLIVIALAVATIAEFARFGTHGFAIIIGTAILVAAPWYLYEAVHNPLFWKSFVAHETISRFVTHLEDETQPADFTLLVFLRETYWLLPIAIPLLLLAATHLRTNAYASVFQRSARALRRLDSAVRLWIVWLLVAFAAACAVQTKLPWYILPALIPAALLTGSILGWALRGWALQTRGWWRNRELAAGVAALLLVMLQVPERVRTISIALATERGRSIPNLAIARKARAAAQQLGAGELYFAGTELPALVYYSGLHCNFVQPLEAKLVGLGRVNEEPLSMGIGDLVLVPIAGRAAVISNLYDVWGVPPPLLQSRLRD